MCRRADSLVAYRYQVDGANLYAPVSNALCFVGADNEHRIPSTPWQIGEKTSRSGVIRISHLIGSAAQYTSKQPVATSKKARMFTVSTTYRGTGRPRASDYNARGQLQREKL